MASSKERKKSALILVDVQYDFLPPSGSLAVPTGDEIIPVVRNFLSPTSSEIQWDLVIASQDYHPQGHISFASTHGLQPFQTIKVPNVTDDNLTDIEDLERGEIDQMLWPDHCVQGTRGSEIEESVMELLKPWIEKGKGKIVQKGTDINRDVYSAFGNPETLRLLQENSINRIFVLGLATDYCVKATCLSAIDSSSVSKNHFEVFLIEDVIRGVAKATTETAMREMRENGVRVVTTTESVLMDR